MNQNLNSLNYYIQYDYLTTDVLIDILNPTKEIYSKIWNDIYTHEINEYRKLEENIYLVEPQLLIHSINTGDSVNLKFSDSYLPKVRFLRKGDVEVQLPKKMGIVALVGYFTVATLTSLSGLAKNTLETQKAFYEKEKARIEYEMKTKQLEKLDANQKAYIDSLNKEKYLSIENSCYELRNVMVNHNNVKIFSVDDVVVYKREEFSGEGGWQIIEDDSEKS